MTQPAHELSIDAENIYHCACGATGTWSEIRPHAVAVGLAQNVDGLTITPALMSERPPYDEDAAQDAIAGRPHWGATVPEKAVRSELEPASTCQHCGAIRSDHQLRGHDFVEWEASS